MYTVNVAKPANATTSNSIAAIPNLSLFLRNNVADGKHTRGNEDIKCCTLNASRFTNIQKNMTNPFNNKRTRAVVLIF